MIYPPPNTQAFHQRRNYGKQSSSFKEIDLYTLDARDMFHLWVAVQRTEGASDQVVEKRLNELTGLDISLAALEFSRDYGANLKDAAILAALGADLARSGNVLSHYYVTQHNGKHYIVFKGNQRLRKIITGTRYLANNSRIMKLGIGGDAMKATLKSGVMVSVIFSTSLNSIKWLFEEDYRWTDWLGHLSVDVTKIIVASVAGYLAATALSGAIIATASTAPVIIPITVGLFVCVYAGYKLNQLDTDYRITPRVIEAVELYERKAFELNRKVSDTILDGVYYVLDSSKKYVARRINRLFVHKARALRQRLSPQWL